MKETLKNIEVSVIIKTYNEENHIARAIESVLTSLEGRNAEVIIADSQSTDQTAKIVQDYPVILVSLASAHQRGCGIGPQLGYQYAHGEYIYLMDGDMEMIPGFIDVAISRMRAQPMLAGIAGMLLELGGGSNYEFEVRKTKESPLRMPGVQHWLVGGGLYRKVAIDSIGYLSNRNLHGNEEKELGLRLTYAGWKMERISEPDVRHYGHTLSSIQLMKARWKSCYVDGPGELLRASWGKPYFWVVLKSQKNLLIITGGWLLLIIALLLSPLTLLPLMIIALILIGAVVVFIFRKGGFIKGMLGLINHQVYAMGYIRGIMRSQVDPNTTIDNVKYK